MIAERKGPSWSYNSNPNVPPEFRWIPIGDDRFVATYLYGPLGPISRTAEFGDGDVANNRDAYYLCDAMGGHSGLLHDHDADGSTAGIFSYTTYDAFGNAMSENSGRTGSFAWRGGDGSVTDLEPNLVYMQSRHYDPTLGRFLQADSLMLASLTTQGMNKYIYCENDPVNMSDPTGRSLVDFVVGVVSMVLGIAALVYGLAGLPIVATISVASLLALAGAAAWVFFAASLFFFGLSLLSADPNTRCLALNVSEYSGVISAGSSVFGLKAALKGALRMVFRNLLLEAAPGWGQSGLEGISDRW